VNFDDREEVIMRRILAGAALALVLAAPQAHALAKGNAMFAIELTHGMADLYDPSSVAGGYISAYDHSEQGVQGQYWMMMTGDYAFNVTAGWGFFNETDKPSSAAGPGAPDQKYSQTSYNIRVGGDRMVGIGDRTLLYFGPGIEYWSGKAKFEGFGPTTVETESITRYALSARIGATMKVSRTWGVTGHVGTRLGMASAKDQGAKVSWWPSSNEGSVGLMFMFGGE
jgi:opacity protein-like surface antigen